MAAAKKIECLHIKAKSVVGFRRCGFGFTAEGAYYEKALFTGDQIKMLKAEPNLLVTDAQIDEGDMEGPFFGVEK